MPLSGVNYTNANNLRSIKIVFIYLVIGILYIYASDYLLKEFAHLTGVNYYILQTGKGIFYVTFTALLLYLAIIRQQATLVKSEREYKELFYSHPSPLWIYDRDTLKFIDVNDAAVRIYGYSKKEFRNMTILDIRPEKDHEKVKQSVKRISYDYHNSGNWEHKKKNGKILTVAITSHQIPFKGRNAIMVMAQDITVRLQQDNRIKEAFRIEKELKQELEKNIALIEQSLEEKNRLAEIVDRINNMVMVTDVEGKVIWVNQAFCDFTGYCFEDLIGNTAAMLQGPKTDPHVQTEIMETIKVKDLASFEVLNYKKSGEEYWVELNISAIRDKDNVVKRYVSIQTIITERKEREARIRKQNETLRKLAWINSHAIRKPVASLLGLVNISDQIEDMEKMKEIHRLIGQCTVEIDEVIKEVSTDINKSEVHDL